MRPPGKYDALRQSGQPEDGPEPVRPTNHPSGQAAYSDRGEPVLSQKTNFDPAEIAKAAKEHEDAANRGREQEKGKGR